MNFLLEPAYFLGMVTFPGASKLFSYTRLLQVSDLHEEDPYDPGRIQVTEKSLQDFFRHNGYFQATIQSRPEIDDAHQLVNLTFTVNLGKQAKVAEVTIQGADSGEASRLLHSVRSLRARLSGALLKRGKPYTPERIKAATKLIKLTLSKQQRLASSVQENPPQYHPEGDVWIHTLMLLDGLPPGGSKTLALGALLHDVGKPPTFRVAPDRIRFDQHAEVGTKMAAEICRRFRLSNEDTEQVLSLVANHMRFADVTRMKESTLKRFFRLPKFEEQLELHRLDCVSSHRDLTLYEFAKEKFHSLPQEQIRPAPLITGADLIAAGYKPGPMFKELLTAVEDAQLEGSISTKEEALKLVRQRAKELA